MILQLGPERDSEPAGRQWKGIQHLTIAGTMLEGGLIIRPLWFSHGPPVVTYGQASEIQFRALTTVCTRAAIEAMRTAGGLPGGASEAIGGILDKAGKAIPDDVAAAIRGVLERGGTNANANPVDGRNAISQRVEPGH